MTESIKSLVAHQDVIALTFRQNLESIHGPDAPVFPPTYPAPERGQHRHDTPYTVNQTSDGTLVCDLDSVQSQANRMESVFGGALAYLVPQHAVKAGNHPAVRLTDLPHRIVDATIRATELAPDISEWMLEVENGNPMPLARVAPTSLVYGAWDSRDTKVKLPRAIRSEIRAHDVSVFTRSAQYSGVFSREDLELSETEWKKGANVGLAPTPAVDAHGGVMVQGEIVHTASILLNVLRKHRHVENANELPNYLLGLVLGGLLIGGRDYVLRTGCALVPAAPAEWHSVSKNGERRGLEISENAIIEEARDIARTWEVLAEVPFGGEPRIHEYQSAAGKAMIPKPKPKKG